MNRWATPPGAWADPNGFRRLMSSDQEIVEGANGLLRILVAAHDPCLRLLRH